MKNWAILTIRLKDEQRSIIGYMIREINSTNKLDIESQLDFLGWTMSEKLNCSISYNIYNSEEISFFTKQKIHYMEGFVQDNNFGFGWHFPNSQMAFSLYQQILSIYNLCGVTYV